MRKKFGQHEAGFGELCVWFKPIRNGEIFSMNNKYGLLTKFVLSRWPDIGHVLFLRVYGPRRRRGP